MTQPAKVQEPSMEEILASIRRIIADDEAKPPAAEKPASPPPPPSRRRCRRQSRAVMKDIPPSAIAPAAASRPLPASPRRLPPRRRRAAVSNSQDDIDAMLDGLDEATPEAEIRPPQPDGDVFELTDEMAVPDPRRRRRSFHKIEPQDDLEFTEPPSARRTAAGLRAAAVRKRRAGAADPVALDRVGGRIRLQLARQYRAQQQRADAGRPGQGNAAADAEVLARRQSAGTGGADRQGRNRAGFARPLALRAPPGRCRPSFSHPIRPNRDA